MATANDTPRVIPMRPPQSALDFARSAFTTPKPLPTKRLSAIRAS
jgi:hypothetical protein